VLAGLDHPRFALRRPVYVALRGLHDPDAFPAGDLGVRKALARNGRLPGEREALSRAERRRPWRAHATLALWSGNPPPEPPGGTPMILETCTVRTPLGPLVLLARGAAVVGLEFPGGRDRLEGMVRHIERHLGACRTRSAADPAGAASRLARYFEGERDALDEQPVEHLGTEFQVAVWRKLRQIRAGSTWTYAQLAAALGRPTATRAVGAANGANPIALFVPCHRVVAADRTLWGYGGGLERKRWLLRHEGAAFVDPAEQRRLY
jgi:methylated-DNA-[protein]-cysteine S-methyltransferase